MRQVTRETAAAFIAGKRKQVGNTVSTGSELVLHGNVIARREGDKILATLSHWPTVTTRERLNGLCVLLGGRGMFGQRKGEQYFGDLRIADDDWVELPC